MATESDVEPRTLASLPAELLMLVAAELDARCLARFAAVCTICPAAAQGELRRELRAAVLRSLVPYVLADTVLKRDECLDILHAVHDADLLPSPNTPAPRGQLKCVELLLRAGARKEDAGMFKESVPAI